VWFHDFKHIMRTNIDIDDALMTQAMAAGPYKTKKDAVEAGLKLLARQAAYREILKWRGKLKWEGDESIDWTRPESARPALAAQEPAPSAYAVASTGTGAKRRARR
jgi:antitoxin ParD1/3/4